jgi:hypothetical protein
MKTQRRKEYIDRYTQRGTGKQMPDLQHSDPGACAATPGAATHERSDGGNGTETCDSRIGVSDMHVLQTQ